MRLEILNEDTDHTRDNFIKREVLYTFFSPSTLT